MGCISSFAPIANTSAKVLILGSMPGVASLAAHQYYAHQRNAFWYIMAQLLDFALDASYPVRCQQLMHHHIALWDVLAHCDRAGSLDSAILRQSEQANDFVGFLQDHPGIKTVFFNGHKAQQVFNRAVKPYLPDLAFLDYVRLPSTSPAMASLSKESKLLHWRCVLDILETMD